MSGPSSPADGDPHVQPRTVQPKTARSRVGECAIPADEATAITDASAPSPPVARDEQQPRVFQRRRLAGLSPEQRARAAERFG